MRSSRARTTPTRFPRACLVSAFGALTLIGCGGSTTDPLAAIPTADSSSEAAAAPETTGDGMAPPNTARIELPVPDVDSDAGDTATNDGATGDGAATNGSSDGSSAGGSAPARTSWPAFSVVAEAAVPTMVARAAPDPAAAVVSDFVNPTEVGAPLVFRAVDETQQSGPASPDWIEVHLPIKPNGATGWVRRSEVRLSNNPYRIEIDRAGFSLKVFESNELWLETPIAVGTGNTPTPVGEFYLLELLAPPDPTGAYGPYAFGLSGFSEVLQNFGGADSAIIGIHGTNDPGSLGTSVSHGCIRLENDVIEQLATTLPLGTPVQIT